MSDPIAERLRVVEADWRELHRQNEMLMELNSGLRKREHDATLQVIALAAEVERLTAEVDALTPCPHAGVTLPIRMKCDLCAKGAKR